KAAIKQFSPDVVHLHELHGYYVNIDDIVRFLADLKIPIVWTFHCEFMYTGKCGYTNDCDKWKTECNHCPQLHEYPTSWVVDRTNSMFKQKRSMFGAATKLRIVTPSEWLKSRVGESFLGGRDVDVVYNGIDTAKTFFPRETHSL